VDAQNSEPKQLPQGEYVITTFIGWPGSYQHITTHGPHPWPPPDLDPTPLHGESYAPASSPARHKKAPSDPLEWALFYSFPRLDDFFPEAFNRSPLHDVALAAAKTKKKRPGGY
jgi:hypothetical protein